jgi:hypothetical protein
MLAAEPQVGWIGTCLRQLLPLTRPSFRRPSRTGPGVRPARPSRGSGLTGDSLLSFLPTSVYGPGLGFGDTGMNIDRRQLLIGAAVAGTFGPVRASPNPLPFGIPDTGYWHPLTRSLLKRARRIGHCRTAPDRAMIERIIRQLTDVSGCAEQPVIKWMDTPSDAFDHLSRFGLDALLDMGTARFWRRSLRPESRDAGTLDRAFEVRLLAGELLGVDELDPFLMAPKLQAKSRAISAAALGSEVFRVRAVSSQIGWLETSLADVAAEAVSNVELLLATGASEVSAPIHHQLTVFEAFECGLLATWETPLGLICVPRQV